VAVLLLFYGAFASRTKPSNGTAREDPRPMNTSMPVGSKADHIVCPLGSAPIVVDELTNARVCSPCGRGKFSEDGLSCKVCAPGTFQSELAATHCSPCPEGEVSGVGETHCVTCPSGKHVDKTTRGCVTCPEGTWSNAGDIFCSTCPPGTYNSQSGRPGCKDCGIGYFNPVEQASSFDYCYKCPKGYSCPFPATGEPLPCPEGYYSSSEGSHTCSKCPLTFGSKPGRSGCVPTTSFFCIVFAASGLLGGFIWLTLLCPHYDGWTRYGKELNDVITNRKLHRRKDRTHVEESKD